MHASMDNSKLLILPVCHCSTVVLMGMTMAVYLSRRNSTSHHSDLKGFRLNEPR